MAVRRINEKRVKKFLGTDDETTLFVVAYWGHSKMHFWVVQSNSNLPSSQNSGKIQYTVIFAADGFVIK